MSRFKKLSHTLWHCQYHIVWIPKYRLRILEEEVKQEVHNCIHTFSEQKRCKVMELNVQKDHIHLIVMVPPKLSISDYMGIIGRPDSNSSVRQVPQVEEKTVLGQSFLVKRLLC